MTHKGLVVNQIKYRQDLKFLTRCSYLESQADWPSWIPHFDIVRDVGVLPRGGSSSCCSRAELVRLDDHVLEVLGKRLGRVKRVSKVPSGLGSDPELSLEVIQAMRELIAGQHLEHSSYIAGGSFIDACHFLFYRDIRKDVLDYSGTTDHEALQIEEDKKLLMSVLVLPTLSSHSSRALLEIAYKTLLPSPYVYNRSLILTEDGYVGLAPNVVEVGDEVCILLGCDAPILLRSSGDACFKVVGEGYVIGLRWNEGLLDALPDYWAAKLPMTGDGFVYIVYMDSRTKQFTRNDPRLGALPNG